MNWTIIILETLVMTVAFTAMVLIPLANLKAVRLPGTEHMDKAYHQKRYHFVHSLWGIEFAAN